jgi:hypothetical protein
VGRRCLNYGTFFVIFTERHMSGAGMMLMMMMMVVIYVLNLIRSENFIDHREVIVSE